MSANKSSHTIKSIEVSMFHFNYHLGRAENKKCGRVLEGASLAEAPDGTRLAPKTYTPKHLVEDRQGGRTASARSRTRVLTARPSSPGTTPNITTAASACSRPTPCTSAWPSSAWWRWCRPASAPRSRGGGSPRAAPARSSEPLSAETWDGGARGPASRGARSGRGGHSAHSAGGRWDEG